MTMNHLGLLMVAVLLPSVNGLWAQRIPVPPIMQVFVPIESRAELVALSQLHVQGDITMKGARLVIDQVDLERVRTAGFKAEVLVADIATFDANMKERIAQHMRIGGCNWLDFEDVVGLIDSLAMANPGICQRVDLGTSVEGRPIVALKVSDNVEMDENEAEILLDACIHGDEYLPQQLLARLARELVMGYGENAVITDLVNDREIWLVPVMNPDGWVNGTRYNANFVDLNRDWGYMWNDWSPGAFSQPETRACRDAFTERHFSLNVSYHAGIEQLLYPWYYREDDCPDDPAATELATAYITYSGYSSLEATSGFELYVTNGSSCEHLYGACGTMSMAMEVATLLEWSDPNAPCTFFPKNKDSMLRMIELGGYGISGTVVDANTQLPVHARISVDGGSPFYSSAEVGDFHKYLVPGVYNITVSANGYQSESVSNVVVPATGSVDIVIGLQPTQQYAAQRVVACRAFNNYADGLVSWSALGEMDGDRYSLGDSGWVVLDIGESVHDGIGTDLTVVEGDSGPEGFLVSVADSPDGPWIELGTGLGTTGFDLAQMNGFEPRYLLLLDSGTGGSGLGAGFDLDAVELSTGSIAAGTESVLSTTESLTVVPIAGTQGYEIRGLDGGRYHLAVYDVLGQLVLSQSEQEAYGNVIIDLHDAPKGVYLLHVGHDLATVASLKLLIH